MADLRCADVSRSVDEPLEGTAPHRRGWLLVHQPGAWGRKPLDSADSGTQQLITAAAALSFGVLATRGEPAPIHARLAADPSIDLAPRLAGAVMRIDRSDPFFLVCVNGKRDACCAIRGREVVDLLRDRDDVLECSHIGGHRFAPTGLLMPWGVAYGRISAESVERILADAREGRLCLDGMRGRTSLTAEQQVAEIVVRREASIHAIDDLTVTGTSIITVAARDGRWWQVRTTAEPSPTKRPESCGADPVALTLWRGDIVGSGHPVA